MDEKQWKATLKEAEETYQEDLVKYTDEIKELKKELIQKQKLITKLNGLPESIYPFIVNIKDRIERMETKFNEVKPNSSQQ